MYFNILVIGPSDSGKTTFIENISQKLDKRFKLNIVNSCSNSTSNDYLNENNNKINENLIEPQKLRSKKSHQKSTIGISKNLKSLKKIIIYENLQNLKLLYFTFRT